MKVRRMGVVTIFTVTTGIVAVLTQAPAMAAPSAYVQIAGSPFATGGSDTTAVAYSPSGSLLAATNLGPDTLSVFNVNADGSLALGPNSPFPVGADPRGVAWRPDGQVLAVANFAAASVRTLAVQANGTVTGAVDTEATGGGTVAAVAFSPNGQFLAAAENTVGRLYVWSVDAGGALTAVPGSPIVVGGGNSSSLAWSPSGTLLATADNEAHRVDVFSIAGNGTPTAAFSNVATPISPVSIAINGAGTLLATANSSGSISTFAMAPNGALSNRQDFSSPGTPRSVRFSPDGTKLASGLGTLNALSVSSVSAGGALTPLAGSPYPTFAGSFAWEAAWNPSGSRIALANGGGTGTSVSVFGPYTAPTNTCPAAEFRASQRHWTFGVDAFLDFDLEGTATATGSTPAPFTAPEGSATVTDTTGQLLFYSEGTTIYDRNGAALPNGTGLLGDPSATQAVAAVAAPGRPGVYFVVTTDANLAGPTAGTLRYSEVDMHLRGGLGDVTGVKNVQLGATGTASEALQIVPDSSGAGFWVLTQQWGASNLLAYRFTGAGPVTNVPVVSAMSTGTTARTINGSPDLTQLVVDSNGRLRVLDFDGLQGTASERYSWNGPAGTYSADFSPSGAYVYTSGINANANLHRFLVAGQPDSAAVAASDQNLGPIGGNGGQVRRGADLRMYAAAQGATALAVVHAPDTAGPPAVTTLTLPGPHSAYGLAQTVAGCALAIDTTPPDTTIDSGPSGTVASSSASFTFHGTAGDTDHFECSLDGVGFTTCTSGVTYNGLTEGEHVFRVRAVDAAGNTDATPASRTFTVDTVGPVVTLTGPSGVYQSPNVTNDHTPTFTFSANEAGSTFECRVDGGPFTSCASPRTLAQLPDGAHTFSVRATDPVGNASAVKTVSFTVKPKCSALGLDIRGLLTLTVCVGPYYFD